MANDGKFRRLQCEQACKKLIDNSSFSINYVNIREDSGIVMLEWKKGYCITNITVEYKIDDITYQTNGHRQYSNDPSSFIWDSNGMFDGENPITMSVVGVEANDDCYMEFELKGTPDVGDNIIVVFAEAIPFSGIYEM